MKKNEYFKVKTEMMNSVAASFCVRAFFDLTTWVKYENINHSSDNVWAFCDVLK